MPSLQEILGRSLTQSLGLSDILNKKRQQTAQGIQSRKDTAITQADNEVRKREEARNSQRGTMDSIFTVAGTVLGAVVGGPQGAALGSKIGGAIIGDQESDISKVTQLGSQAFNLYDTNKKADLAKKAKAALETRKTEADIALTEAKTKAAGAPKTLSIDKVIGLASSLLTSGTASAEEVNKLLTGGDVKDLKLQKPPEKKKKAIIANSEQEKASGFANRVLEANNIFDDLTKKGYDPTSVGSAIQGVLPDFMNALKTSERQQLEQAQRNFINAVLRRESGAAISPTEFESGEKQYFPKAGDKIDTVNQKRKNRLTVLNSLIAGSSNAFKIGGIPVNEMSDEEKKALSDNGLLPKGLY